MVPGREQHSNQSRGKLIQTTTYDQRCLYRHLCCYPVTDHWALSTVSFTYSSELICNFSIHPCIRTQYICSQHSSKCSSSNKPGDCHVRCVCNVCNTSVKRAFPPAEIELCAVIKQFKCRYPHKKVNGFMSTFGTLRYDVTNTSQCLQIWEFNFDI